MKDISDNNFLISISTPKVADIFEERVIADNESPPKPKIVSVKLILLVFKVSSISLINSLSVLFLGCIFSLSLLLIEGRGKAFVSIFPLGVNGNLSILTILGIM